MPKLPPAGRLAALKGRWLLSLNDVPEVRRLFAGFTLEPVRLSYGIQRGAKDARELLISPR